MRNFFLYLVLILGAYICQTVLYPVLLVPELRVDLFLVLLLHFSFFYERSKSLVLALFLGLLMDVGLPLKGSFHPLIYLGIALLASLLWHNLNLHSRRYQAIFLGLCSLLEGVGIWIILGLQDAEFVETPYLLKILAWRTIATALVGPFLLAVLERLDQRLGSLSDLRETQEA
jgi:cell shape-determining protein MreD